VKVTWAHDPSAQPRSEWRDAQSVRKLARLALIVAESLEQCVLPLDFLHLLSILPVIDDASGIHKLLQHLVDRWVMVAERKNTSATESTTDNYCHPRTQAARSSR